MYNLSNTYVTFCELSPSPLRCDETNDACAWPPLPETAFLGPSVKQMQLDNVVFLLASSHRSRVVSSLFLAYLLRYEASTLVKYLTVLWCVSNCFLNCAFS